MSANNEETALLLGAMIVIGVLAVVADALATSCVDPISKIIHGARLLGPVLIGAAVVVPLGIIRIQRSRNSLYRGPGMWTIGLSAMLLIVGSVLVVGGSTLADSYGAQCAQGLFATLYGHADNFVSSIL